MNPNFDPNKIVDDVASRNPDAPKPTTFDTDFTTAANKMGKGKNPQMQTFQNQTSVSKEQIVDKAAKALQIAPENLGKFEPLFNALTADPKRALEFYNTTGEYQTGSGKMNVLNNLLSPYTNQNKQFAKQMNADADVSTIRNFDSIQKQKDKYVNDYSQAYVNNDFETISKLDEQLPALAKKYNFLAEQITPELKTRAAEKIKQIEQKQKEEDVIREAYKDYFKNDVDINDFLNAEKIREQQTKQSSILANPVFSALQAFTSGLNRSGRQMAAPFVAKINALNNGTDYNKELVSLKQKMEIDDIASGNQEVMKSPVNQIVSGVGQILDAAAFTGLNPGAAIAGKSFVYGFGSTFFDNYTEALQTNNDPKLALLETSVRSSITGLSEIIIPEAKILRGLRDIPQLIRTGKITYNAALNLIKNGVHESIEEIADQAGQIGVDAIKDKLADGEFNIVNNQEYLTQQKEQAVNTFLVTMASSVIAGLPNTAKTIYRNKKNPQEFLNSAFIEMASNDENYSETLTNIDKSVQKGLISKSEAGVAVDKLNAYRETFKIIENSNLSEGAQNELLNSVKSIVYSGDSKHMETLNNSLFNVAVNESPELVQQNISEINNVAKEIELAARKEQIAKQMGVQPNDTEISTGVQNAIDLNDDTEIVAEQKTLDGANTRLGQIEQEKTQLDEAIKVYDEQMSSENINPSFKAALQESKDEKLAQKASLVKEETLIQQKLPELEKQAETKTQEVKTNEQKTDTTKPDTANNGLNNDNTQSDTLEKERKKEIASKTQNISTADVRRPNGGIGTQGFDPSQMKDLVGYMNDELQLGIPNELLDKNEESLKPLINYIKDNNLSSKIIDFVQQNPSEISTLPDGTIEFKDGNHRANLLNILGSETLPVIDQNEAKTINNKYDNLKQNKETTNGINQNEGKIENKGNQGQREVLNTPITPVNDAVEKQNQGVLVNDAPKPIENNTNEKKSPTKVIQKTKQDLINGIIDSNPELSNEEIENKVKDEYQKKIVSGEIPAPKNEAMNKRILSSEIKNALIKKGRLAAKKSKRLASKRSQKQTLKSFENLREAINKAENEIPNNKKVNMTGFFDILNKIDSDIKLNPIYYATQNKASLTQNNAVEIRKTVNSVVLNLSGYIQNNFSSVNKIAENLSEENKTQILAELKAGLYKEISEQINQIYGITMPNGMAMVPINDFESNSEKEINNAINNYVVSVVNSLTSATNTNQHHFLDYYEQAHVITQGNINSPKFIPKSQEVLRRITNGEVIDDVVLETIETDLESNFGARDVVPNNEKSPEANLVNAFYTSIKKLLRQKHGIDSSFNTEQLVSLMFHSFPTPYDAINYAKNVTGLDNISQTIIKETGNLMEEYFDAMMGEDSLNPAKLIFLNNQMRNVFENKPRRNLQVSITSNGLAAYSINIGDSLQSIQNELANGLYLAKSILKSNTETKRRYENLWQDINNDPANSYDKILELVDMFNNVTEESEGSIGLLKDMFNVQKIQTISNYTTKSEMEVAMFNSFLADIFSPIEQDLNNPKFVLLKMFLEKYLNKSLNGGLIVPQNKLYNQGKKQTENATARPNVISTWTDKLNLVAKKILSKNDDIQDFYAEFKKAVVGTPLAKFVKPENQFNIYFTEPQIMQSLTENEIHSFKNTTQGQTVDNIQKIDNANEEQRLLAGLANYFNSRKFGNNWFSNLFMPSNKPKLKSYRVPRFKRMNDMFYYEDILVVGDNLKPGMFENYISSIIGSSKLSVLELQKWLPEFFEVKKVNNKNTIELNNDKLKDEANKLFKKFVEIQFLSKVNMAPKVNFGNAPSLLDIESFYSGILNQLVSNPDNIKENAKTILKTIENKKAVDTVIGSKDLVQFLKSIEQNQLLDSGLELFEDYLINFAVNQQYINNAFVAPINVLAESGEKPQFYYERVNSLIAPGSIAHIERDERYAVVKFDFADGYGTNANGEKVIEIIDVDTNGSPIKLEIPFSKFDGVEFITPQYSIDVTIGVGVYSRILGNLKKATMGMTNEGKFALHKNMSVVLTKELRKNNPAMETLYQSMVKNNLDKIVTSDGTKSKSEKQNITVATIKNNELVFDKDLEVNSISCESTVVQLPVNLVQSDESGNTRQGKLATQMLDQIPVMAGNRATEILDHAAKALEYNQKIANNAIRKFTGVINVLQNTVFEYPDANNEQIEQYNNQIAQKRSQLLDQLVNIFETYSSNMQERIGKEASAKFVKVLERLKTNTNPLNPKYSFETDVTGIYEIFNDIVRTSQSIWISGGWHSLNSDALLKSDTLAFKNLQNNRYEGEVMLNQDSANQLGLNEGDSLLLQKLPFNNMATKLFATLKIGPISGSSMVLPSEWMAITSSDFDGDAVGSLKIDLNYKETVKNKLSMIVDNLENMNDSQIEEFLKDNQSALNQFYEIKSYENAQAVLNKLRDVQINGTDIKPNLMQLQQVTVDNWVKASDELNFAISNDNINTPNAQARRGGLTEMTQSGIGIAASASSTFYRMAYTNSSLTNANNINLSSNNVTYSIGKPVLDINKGETINNDGSSMIEPLSNFLQIMVDSFKNNYAEKFGLNSQNVLHAQLLAQSGLDEKKILTIINQPIFKLYSSLKYQGNNPLLPANQRNNDQLFYLRATLAEIINTRSMNQTLLNKLGFENGRYIGLNNRTYNIELDKIKSNYIVNGNNVPVNNITENPFNLIRQIKTMSNEQIEGQIETLQLLLSTRSMVRDMESWIKIRKKFQDGFTNPHEIPDFEAKLVKMGMLTEIGKSQVEQTSFEHIDLNTNEIENIQNDLKQYNGIIDNIENYANTIYKNQVEKYFSQGFDTKSLKEFLKYKVRLLNAANVNGKWVKTFYIADSIFRTQADGFFMGAAQSSSLIPMNKQDKQAANQKEIASVADGKNAVQFAYEMQNYALLKQAKETIFNEVFQETNPIKKAELLDNLFASIENILDTMYKYKSEFINNSFMKHLEFVTIGSSIPVGKRNNKDIYTDKFHFYTNSMMSPVDKSEVRDLSEEISKLEKQLGIEGKIEEIINENVTDNQKSDSFKTLLSNIFNSTAKGLGLTKSTLDFLLTLKYIQATENNLPVDFVIYQDMIYDAATGMPIFGNDKTNPLFQLPITDKVYFEDIVDNANNDNFLYSAQIGVGSIRQMLHSEENGFDLARTFVNLIHIHIEGTGGDKRLSPMYRKSKDSKVQLSIDRQTGVVDFEAVKQSLENIGDDLVKDITVLDENGQLSQSNLYSELSKSSRNDDFSLNVIFNEMSNGNFGDLYGLYFSNATENFNTWANIKPILSQRVNQILLIEQSKMIKSNTSDVTAEEKVINKPTRTLKVDWDLIQNLTMEDMNNYQKTYYHTVDPNNNVILFKKVLLTTDSAQVITLKGEKRVSTKQTGLFFPIGFYTANHENNYVLTSTNSQNPLLTLSKINAHELTNQKILKMISGIVMANEIENMPENFDIAQFQQQMKELTGLKETPSPGAILQKIGTDSVLMNKIREIVGAPNLMPVLAKIKTFLGFLNQTINVNAETKLFQNSIFASEPSLDSFKKSFDSEQAKTDFQNKNNTLSKKARLRSFRNTPLNILNKLGSRVSNLSVEDYVKRNNNGNMPANFKELMQSILKDISPSYGPFAGQLINKIGTAKIQFVNAADYLQEEINSNMAPNSSKMLYDEQSNTIIINKEEMMDLDNHPEAILHEGIHALTANLYDTNQGFKTELDSIVTYFKKVWTDNKNSSILNFKAAEQNGLADIIQETVIDETDTAIAAKEFIAYVMSSNNAKMFKLLNEITSNGIVPSNMKNNLWNRIITSIVKFISFANVNKNSLLQDMINLLDNYYENLGATSVNAIQPIGDTHYSVNGEVFVNPSFLIDDYLVNQGVDFHQVIEEEFLAKTGQMPSNTDFVEMRKQENEILIIKHLMYMAKTNPNVINQLNTILNVSSQRARSFAQSFARNIDIDYFKAGEIEFASDLKLAGYLDGMYYNANNELVMDVVHAEDYYEYENALNNAIAKQEMITEAIAGLPKQPPAKAVLKGGILAHIKESQGEVVKTLRIMSVDQSGGIKTISVDYSLIRPYINDVINSYNSAMNSSVKRIESSSAIGFAPDVNLSSVGNVINMEDPSIDNPNLLDAVTELFNRKEKVISKMNIHKTQVKQFVKIYKDVITGIYNGAYRSYNSSDLAKFEAYTRFLHEQNLVSDETLNYVLQEYMMLSENISLSKAVQDITNAKDTPDELVDMTTLGFDKIAQLFLTPASWSMHKQQIGKMFYQMNQKSDNMLTDAAMTKLSAKNLWNDVLKERNLLNKGFLSGLKNKIRLNKNIELDLMNRFSKSGPNGTRVFKTIDEVQNENFTMAEMKYYNFVSSKMEQIMNDIFMTKKIGGNPLLGDSYLYQFYKKNEDTEEYELQQIPVPASGMKYNSLLNSWMHTFKGEKRKNWNQLVIAYQLKAYGNKLIAFEDPNDKKRKVKSVNDWVDIISQFPNAQALQYMNQINEIAKNPNNAGNIKGFKRFKRKINLRSMIVGKDIYQKEADVSNDLNYNFSTFLDEVHAIRIGQHVNSYADAFNYIIDNTIEKDADQSSAKAIIGEFIDSKYFNKSNAKKSKQDLLGRKAIKVLNDYMTSLALGFNFSAQVVDLVADTLSLTIDNGELKKSYQGIKTGVKLLTKNTETQNKNIFAFFDGLKNIDKVKKILAIDNVLPEGVYKNLKPGLTDKMLNSMYVMYKFNDYIKMMSIVGGEISESAFTSIFDKIKNGESLTYNQMQAINSAMAKYLSLAGGVSKSTSIRHQDTLSSQMLKFKTWVVPAFNRKWGNVAAKSGEYTNRPVYSSSVLLALNFLHNKTGKNVFKLNDQNQIAIDSYTREDIAKIQKALAMNMFTIMSTLAYLSMAYWDDEEDENGIKELIKNHKKAIEYGKFDYLLMFSILTQALIGANPIAILAGLVISSLGPRIQDMFIPVSEKSKYNSQFAKILDKATPIGNLIESINPDYLLSDYKINEKKKWEQKHGYKHLIDRISN